ncbi:Replicative DNA helicase [Paraburkholderia phenoliruptrix]|uniref:Replicative DNA helicase n=1 Tax=Paraburkholderia phenoliruptrix TaxID=252970 RepID=A0A6J5CB43_9BURK|nr:replicative DNA helicase [Paraburkholderia phenoliruptrix]CAB3730130.1 Replicative DNA helicase [Paraburkholderia phenoliruptrix]
MNAPDRIPENLAVPPHSQEAEQSVLGALLIDNDAIDRIPELRADQFYRYDHRIIFECIARMIMAGRNADVVTVYEALGTAGKVDQIGGLPYLNALAQNVPGSAGIRRYAEIVIERAQLRGVLCAVDEIGAMVHNRAGKTAAEIIAEAQARFEPLAEARSFEPKEVGPILTSIVEEIDARYHGAELPVVSTGFRDLDAKLGGGLRGSELVVVAGRPSMGKTAFSMAIAGNVAQEGGSVLVFSLEMSGKSLHQRNIARVGGIRLDHVLDGKKIVEEDWPRLTHAVQVMSEMQMLVDDQSGLSLAEIVSRSRNVKRRSGLDLILVDYIGLMTGGTEERQDLKIGSYSAGLKGLAKQLDVPVIALAQLNRGVEQRPNKRPNMGDLRDSGAIEQDADIILMLYRDEVYNPDSPDRGTAEIIVGKQRNGETGPVRLAFAGEYQRFADLAPGYVRSEQPERQRARRGFE